MVQMPNARYPFHISSTVPHKAVGGSIKNRKPIGEVNCRAASMAERTH